MNDETNTYKMDEKKGKHVSNVIPFRPRRARPQPPETRPFVTTEPTNVAGPLADACAQCGESIDSMNPRADFTGWPDITARSREFGKARLNAAPGCLWCVRDRTFKYAIHALKSSSDDSEDMLRTAEHVANVLADLVAGTNRIDP